jgi:hypothetical protein
MASKKEFKSLLRARQKYIYPRRLAGGTRVRARDLRGLIPTFSRKELFVREDHEAGAYAAFSNYFPLDRMIQKS